LDGDTAWLVLGVGLGLALIIEGLLPFLSPPAWRRMIAQVQQLNDGQIRFFGLCCILAGAVLVIALL
jgi:uncharacterized protein